MKHLGSLNKYFWKYKWLFLLGLIFIILSNYFRILSPQITKYVLNVVQVSLAAPVPESPLASEGKSGSGKTAVKPHSSTYDPLVQKYIVEKIGASAFSFKNKIIFCGIILWHLL